MRAAPRCRASSGNRCASGSDGPLQVATLALVIRALRRGSRRTIGVAATVLAALVLLHLIWILVRQVPGDLLQPAREEPLAFGLTATAVEQQPEHLRWTAEDRGRLAWSPQ
jgi:hypothetical protein